jgi:hypothetical protein
LKHEKRITLLNSLKVSKLIKKLGPTAAPFQFKVKEVSTRDELTKINADSHKNLKNYPVKMLDINKLEPNFKEHVSLRDPKRLNETAHI